MPTDISDNSLIWEADIDFTKIKQKSAEIDRLFSQIGKKLSFDDQITKAASSSDVAVKQVNQTLQETVVIEQKTADIITKKTAAQKAFNAEMDKTLSKEEQQDILLNQVHPGTYNPGGGTGKKPVFNTVPTVDTELSKDLQNYLDNARRGFIELDAITAAYIDELVELQVQQRNVKQKQAELNAAFDSGVIKETEYITSSALIAAENKKIADSIALVNQRQREYEATINEVVVENTAVEGSLEGLNLELKKLQASFAKLGPAAAAGLEGQGIQAAIANTEGQISRLSVKTADAGNAIVSTGKKTFGFIRQLAYILPGVGIAGIIGFITSAITGLFEKLFSSTKNTANSFKLITDAYAKLSDKIVTQRAAIEPYVNALKDANLTEQERLNIYNKLLEIDPQIVKGIDAKTISYDALAENVKKYTDSLRNQIALEANKDALTQSIKTEQDLQKQILAAQSKVDNLNAAIASGKALPLNQQPAGTRAYYEGIIDDVQKLNKELTKQQQTSENFGKVVVKIGNIQQEQTGRTTAQIEKEIAAQKKLQADATSQREFDIIQSRVNELQKELDVREKISTRSRSVEVIDLDIEIQKKAQSFAVTKAEYDLIQKRIDALNKEREAITGASKTTISLENAYQSLLDKRKKALEDIANLQRDATQTGSLLKIATQVDNINQKYDNQIQKLKDLNQQIQRFNNTHKGADVPLIGQSDFNKVEAARQVELINFHYKDDTANYIAGLEAKKDGFQKYQEALLTGNQEIIDQAKRLYGQDAANYGSYLEFLKAQRDAILSKIRHGTATGLDIAEGIQLGDLIKKEIPKQDVIDTEKAKKDLADLLSNITEFEVKRNAIEAHYATLRAVINDKANGYTDDQRKAKLAILTENMDKELNANAEAAIQMEDVFRHFYESKDELGIKDLQNVILRAKKEQAEVGITTAKYNALQHTIDLTNDAINAKKAAIIKDIADNVSKLGSVLSQATGDLSAFGQILEGLASEVGNLQTVFSKTATSEQKISAGVGAAIDLVNIVISSAKERKRVEEEYYASIVKQQQDYNILLNEQIGLQSELSGSVFITDYQGKLTDGFRQLRDATQKYQDSLTALQDGQANLGLKKVVDGKSVLQGVGSGVVLGAAIGSVVPVIGTAIGAVVGGIVGGIVGIFGGKKEKQIFGDLLTTYPELLKQGTNGYKELNVELAKTLIETGAVDDKTKELLQSAVDWTDQIQAAREAMTSVISDIAGSLGDDLRTALVSAFEDGTDAAKAFGDSVSKTLENVISQLLFNQVFSKAFKGLEDDMLKSFDIGGDNNWIDDFDRFFQQAGTLTDNFNQGLKDAQDAAEKFNLNIFKGTSANADTGNSLTGAVKGITEQQAELLAGQFGGLRLTALEQLQVARDQFLTLGRIDNNTFLTADRLQALLTKFDNYESGTKWIYNKLK